MTIWAIVPVKPLNRSKSRLASVLDRRDREILSRQMLERTLRILTQVKSIAGILVVSRDSAALALARRYDAQTVQESGTPELNDALTRATQVVSTWSAKGALILASDIPLMRASDLEGMLTLASEPGVIVIAGDRHHDGTNALIVKPPGLIPYCYGAQSFARHIAEAKRVDAAVHLFESPTLALDVDVPDDLTLYRSILAEQGVRERARLAAL